jgi:hypothetical protein
VTDVLERLPSDPAAVDSQRLNTLRELRAALALSSSDTLSQPSNPSGAHGDLASSCTPDHFITSNL